MEDDFLNLKTEKLVLKLSDFDNEEILRMVFRAFTNLKVLVIDDYSNSDYNFEEYEWLGFCEIPASLEELKIKSSGDQDIKEEMVYGLLERLKP